MQQVDCKYYEHLGLPAETTAIGGAGQAPRKLLKDCKLPSRPC